MVRFLIFFQYLGTKYSGLAKASQKWSEKRGVLDVLEEAIQRLTPIQVANVTSSCRTDSGVHALVNTVHVDLERPSHKQPFTPHSLARGINRELRGEDVRVVRVCEVQDTFHARHNVIRRDYLYRVVLGCEHPKEMPVFEKNRCYAMRESNLDLLKMKEASRLFIGLHDFASFRNLRNDYKDLYTKREMYSVSIYHPCSQHDNHFLHPFQYKYLYLEFSARSYLYRQIRRMVGVLLAVGRGNLTPSDVGDMLQSRDNTNLRGTQPAPAGGSISRMSYMMKETFITIAIKRRNEGGTRGQQMQNVSGDPQEWYRKASRLKILACGDVQYFNWPEKQKHWKY